MAKANYTVHTATGRELLSPRRDPYWHKIVKGQYVGYRKLKDGTGSWIARYTTSERKYKFQSLDSGIDFEEAVKQAQAFCKIEDGGGSASYTVRDAVDAYIDDRRAEKGKNKAEKIRKDVERHLTPALLKTPVSKLTTAQLKKWRNSMVKDSEDSDAVRRSRNTANRYWSNFKACLNMAYGDGKVTSNAAWGPKKVKKFKGVESARKVFLDIDQVKALLDSTSGSFRHLCEAALLTGMRYGEIASLLTEDFNQEEGTLELRDGKTGGRTIFLNDVTVKAFIRYTKDKLPKAILIPKDDGTRWDKNHQQVPMQQAVIAAKLPAGTVFYTLRHTHISRACVAGVQLQVLAENCGTSVEMITKHYAKFLKKDRRDMFNNVEFGA